MRRFEPYAFDGTQKLFDFPHGSGMPHPLPPILVVSAVIELVGGLMIALGIFASYAAFIASGQMAVAYFVAHFQFGKASFWPIVNKGELAVVYCFVFLFIFAHGAGIWSVTKK